MEEIYHPDLIKQKIDAFNQEINKRFDKELKTISSITKENFSEMVSQVVYEEVKIQLKKQNDKINTRL